MKEKIGRWFAILCVVLCVKGGICRTVSVEFIQTTATEKSREVVKGHIYHVGGRTSIITREPLTQWMILEKNTMLIYYPEEKKAIRILSQSPVTLSFFRTFVGLLDDNMGLAKLGYTIGRKEVQGDTFRVHWKPPDGADKYLGEFILSLKDDRIVRTQSSTADGKTTIVTTYGRFFKHLNRYFPLEIVSASRAGRAVTVETTLYNDPVFDGSIPLEITQFSLPKNIEVKEVEW